ASAPDCPASTPADPPRTCCCAKDFLSLKHRESETDTPQGPQPGGLSVHPCRHPRESPQALPASVNVSGRVLVAVQHQARAETAMGTDTQAFLHPCPTDTTVLPRVGGCQHPNTPTPQHSNTPTPQHPNTRFPAHAAGPAAGAQSSPACPWH